MIKWLGVTICFACTGCTLVALADTTPPPAVQSQDDPTGVCGPLLAQPDSNPPDGSTDQTTIDNIQSCLTSCNQLYQSYADQGDYDNMLSGITYCRADLSNLYNQSIYLQANANLAGSSTGGGGQTVSQQPAAMPQQNIIQRTFRSPPSQPTGSSPKQQPGPSGGNKKQPQINWF